MSILQREGIQGDRQRREKRERQMSNQRDREKGRERESNQHFDVIRCEMKLIIFVHQFPESLVRFHITVFIYSPMFSTYFVLPIFFLFYIYVESNRLTLIILIWRGGGYLAMSRNIFFLTNISLLKTVSSPSPPYN